MRSTECIRVLGLGLCILLFCAPVRAENYWGFGVGVASTDLKPFSGTQEIDDGTMFKVIFGSRTFDHAIEFDISLGVFDWVGASEGSHTVGNVSISGLAFMPIGDPLDLFGRLGVNLSASQGKSQGDFSSGSVGLGITYGGGLILYLTETFNLRAEYQVITGINDGINVGNIDWLSVQAVFKWQ